MKKCLVLMILLGGILLSCGDAGSHDISIPETGATESETTFSVTTEMLGEYEVIRPEYASNDGIRTASALFKELKNINGALTFRHDFWREGVEDLAMGEYEILIGNTNRPQSAAFLESLRASDYGFAMMDHCIVIAGHTDETTALAAQLFLETVKNAAETGVFYDSAMDTVICGEYAADTFAINGVPVREYEILIGDGKHSEAAAEKLRDKIAERTGYVLDLTEEGTSSNTITVGEGECGITVSGGIHITGDDRLSLMQSVLAFEEILEDAIAQSEEKSIELSLPDGYSADPATYDAMKAMSFNVLYKDPDTRAQRVADIIRKYSPDTFGVQEASPAWMTKLRSSFREEYDSVGFGRDGGNQGEYNAIFYKKDVFDLIDSGTRYLSDTPERKSKVPESSLNRIFTYALLETRSDGERILFVNTHFDHTSDVARTKQAKILADFLSENDDYPIILSGDFNTASGSAAYEEILDGGVENSMELAGTKETGATYTNYGKSKSVIDFIFVTEADICVENYRVCGEKIDGEYPSDHHPVLIEYVNCN